MTDRDDDDTDDRDLERLFARRRERSARPDAIAALWERIEDRIATTPGQDERAQPAGGRSRRAAAAWFGAGFAVAAAIASLIAVSVRSAPPADQASGVGPPAAGLEPAVSTARVDDDDDVAPRLDDSSRAALADAERAYEHALDVVEADYRAKRDSLPADVAVRIDASFRDTRRMRDEARDEAGDDVDARLLLLDTYAVQLHTLQSALDDID
jgi:hypothetical protein